VTACFFMCCPQLLEVERIYECGYFMIYKSW
jgi:hypothetical protein